MTLDAVAGSAATMLNTSTDRQTSRALQLSPVQSTSLLTAFWRKIESNSSAPLIHDKPASTLVSALLSDDLKEKWLASPILDCGVDVLAVRSRAIDDWLQSSSAMLQVVNLGAGMCCRPYRLDLRGVGSDRKIAWFEVDDPHLLATKRAALEDDGVAVNVDRLVDVAGNVTDIGSLTESLLQADFVSSIPTYWILEGLLEYLDPNCHEAIFEMARRLGGSAESRIVMQVLEPQTLEYFTDLGVDLPYQKLVCADHVVDGLHKAGWRNVRVRREKEFLELYGRSPTLPGFCLVDATVGTV
eukprot:TRINITY_DN38978_c0_g1_i1.p1 TRINITY_DN38978_c0_g1~~TRINITY_DN38978_c0_g1_i1.p1  ORF type:complete len:299 (+),score=39.27 TRINITY_DN38978_c0_g1_i1:101-997(+)